eukprot:TRINITY_DN2322_c0_g1_i2.p1 TRINITY_DN2322_c0_g1~~TRINITY_DN2322_c0_g1_i2.p1  ORF type:complete len:393 (+),score=112.97 TRINITY_DN2322_c0_g1_i2:165-1343(+)
MAQATPYIGSKISLVSNALIAYEGILYTINSQESTIALQSVRCLGTQGRKEPEIPPSNEIYDFIIFRGQDIKDLTVLETGNPAMNDPAILSVNRQPPAQHGAAPATKGNDKGASKGSPEKGAGAKGKGYESEKGKGTGKDWESAKGIDYESKGWKGGDSGKGREKGKNGKDGKDAGKRGGKDSYAAKGGKEAGGKGDRDAGKGKGEGKGGKNGSKGGDAAKSAKGKGGEPAKGDSSRAKGGKGKDGRAETAKGKGEKAKGESGEKGSSRRSHRGGGGGGGGGNGVIGELLPKANSETKRQCAEDFDYASSNQKFDKVEDSEDLKPLDGYNKGKSFFDNISCQATERTGEAGRPRADREKVREADLEAFGDAKPPSTRERRGKGRRKGGKADN